MTLPVRNVVICGGGIIGAATAYYLSILDIKKTLNITIIERESVACHSSGKAGGFLALDWHNAELEPIARLSYSLHEELSKTFKKENIGYRNVNTYSVNSRTCKSSSTESKQNNRSWVDGKISQKETIGTTRTTAQVSPFILTNELMNSAITNAGAKLKKGIIVDIEKNIDEIVTHVVLSDGSRIDADVVVIAMGAWSFQVAEFFPLCQNAFNVKGSRAHSIILEADIPPEAMFIQHVDKDGKFHDPEIYPRPDGTVYICGEGDDAKLPQDPSEIVACPKACEKLHEIAKSLSSHLKDAKVLTQQACYVPFSPDNIPIIGKLPFYEEAYIGTGHGCWGILNGPATGKCLAQLILKMKPDIDLTAFSPKRFIMS